MSYLIIYPHGLGDIILLTPALREFVKSGHKKPSVAVMKRFAGSGILDGCPWIDNCYYALPDPWNDEGGRNRCKQIGISFATNCNLLPLWIWHPSHVHKIIYNFKMLGISSPADPRTEIYITDFHRSIVDKMPLPDRFGFIQTTTGVKGLTDIAHIKDLPPGFGRRWIEEKQGIRDTVEVGVTFSYDEYAIPIQFEIMRRSSAVCLPDSVFYHACHAMGKSVDFAYFGGGKLIYDTVKPLFPAKENVKFSLNRPEKEENRKSEIETWSEKGGLNGSFMNGYSKDESNQEVHKILNLLKENTPFAYSRFNDGEMIAIVNRSGIIARGAQQITPQLADKLTMSLLYEQENYWKGLICKSCFPDLHPMAMKLVGNYPYLTSAVALVNRNWRTFLIECRQHLQDRKIIWIGGEDQNTDNLNTFLGISISKTYRYCNQNTWDLYDQIKMLIGEFEPGNVVFISLGPVSRILAQEWFAIMPQTTFIDIGSVFDPFTRNVWHPYHRGWHNGFNAEKRCTICN